MSDNEGHGGLPPSDDDLSLPKATVAKMISGENGSHVCHSLRVAHGFTTFCHAEFLPKDVSCSKETRDLIIECCVGEDVPCTSPYIHLTAPLFRIYTFDILRSQRNLRARVEEDHCTRAYNQRIESASINAWSFAVVP